MKAYVVTVDRDWIKAHVTGHPKFKGCVLVGEKYSRYMGGVLRRLETLQAVVFASLSL